MIGIIDYDSGNIFSLRAAFQRLGVDQKLVTAPSDVKNYQALVLPGVGAFGDAINSLKETGLDQVVLDWVSTRKPLLGICLGMQLLFENSEEHGIHQGLGILPGTIKRIPSQVKVPHMGWNNLDFLQDNSLFQNIQNNGHVYFVHSYYADTTPEVILASTFYAEKIPAIVGKGNVLGMQFHPEKSSSVGMRLLENWAKSVGA